MSQIRPLLYDLTHLSHRAEIRAPSGIDRVDLMFARRFAQSPALAGAIYYGARRPSILAPSELATVVARAERRWRGVRDADPAFARLRAWILGAASKPRSSEGRDGAAWRELVRRARIGRFKLVSKAKTPEGAVYLNIAQHALERRSHFDWLSARPDVRPVFFLHDLLPLDYPEFWPAGHERLFAARMDTLFAFARGVITSSDAVAHRVVEECARHGRPAPPLLARPLPSPLQLDADAHDPELTAARYFLMVGTIEPRKNHLTVLNLWRAMIESGRRPPKLVLVGGRGWLNDETAAVLDRCPAFEGVVAQTSGLGDKALRTLISNARALLAPSFAEGYGLPIAEALELGAPVIASDLPVFREVSQGDAILIDPSDGVAWRSAILALCDEQSSFAREAKRKALNHPRVNPGAYFDCVEAFVNGL